LWHINLLKAFREVEIGPSKIRKFSSNLCDLRTKIHREKSRKIQERNVEKRGRAIKLVRKPVFGD